MTMSMSACLTLLSRCHRCGPARQDEAILQVPSNASAPGIATFGRPRIAAQCTGGSFVNGSGTAVFLPPECSSTRVRTGNLSALTLHDAKHGICRTVPRRRLCSKRCSKPTTISKQWWLTSCQSQVLRRNRRRSRLPTWKGHPNQLPQEWKRLTSHGTRQTPQALYPLQQTSSSSR